MLSIDTFRLDIQKAEAYFSKYLDGRSYEVWDHEKKSLTSLLPLDKSYSFLTHGPEAFYIFLQQVLRVSVATNDLETLRSLVQAEPPIDPKNKKICRIVRSVLTDIIVAPNHKPLFDCVMSCPDLQDFIINESYYFLPIAVTYGARDIQEILLQKFLEKNPKELHLKTWIRTICCSLSRELSLMEPLTIDIELKKKWQSNIIAFLVQLSFDYPKPFQTELKEAPYTLSFLMPFRDQFLKAISKHINKIADDAHAIETRAHCLETLRDIQHSPERINVHDQHPMYRICGGSSGFLHGFFSMLQGDESDELVKLVKAYIEPLEKVLTNLSDSRDQTTNSMFIF